MCFPFYDQNAEGIVSSLLLFLCSVINTHATPAAVLRIISVGQTAAHVCLCLSPALREWTVERLSAFQPIRPHLEMSFMAMTTAPKRSPLARSLRLPSGRNDAMTYLFL